MGPIHVSRDGLGGGMSADSKIASQIATDDASAQAGRTICGLATSTLPAGEVVYWVAINEVKRLAQEGKLCPECAEQARDAYDLQA